MNDRERTDDVIERKVGEALRKQGHTVAPAESCTGGLIGARLTAVPGSSDYVDRGFVTYSYDSKREVLGVSREALDEVGAVSDRVAREMAQGARDVADVTWGISATGVAGPGGGTDETPVGTVFIGISYAAPWGTNESYTTATRHEFDGDRTAVRTQTVEAALQRLLSEIQSLD